MVSLLLLVLALLVVSVLHTAYAVVDTQERCNAANGERRSSTVSAVATERRKARYAAAPLAHFTGLGMLWLSDGNVWVTGVLVKILPTAVALLLLPPVSCRWCAR